MCKPHHDENFWEGKTLSFLGDSITAFENYQYKVQQLLRAGDVNSYGLAGSTISGPSEWSFVGRAPAVATDSDLVFVFGGTNDYHYNMQIGTFSDAAEWNSEEDHGTKARETFYGALGFLCRVLKKQCPRAQIVFATPLQRIMEAESGENGINQLGYRLEDYCRAIREVCGAYGIAVADLNRNSRITEETAAQYLYDGLHPNEEGFVILAGDIAAELMK